jgi:molybdate transport system substrate-binding protein
VNHARRRRGIACLALLVAIGLPPAARAEEARVAAAADLTYALDALAPMFEARHPGQTITLIYGSSGKLSQQIDNGAPFDLFFSADRSMPDRLIANGTAISPAVVYAHGQLVLWSAHRDMHGIRVADLASAAIGKVAIAEPRHAPYGQRAVEALQRAGVYAQVKPKLVYGENIAQAAQMAQSGGTDVGILALSLALGPKLAGQGTYRRVPESLYSPLEQAVVLTRHGRDNATAKAFLAYLQTPEARALLQRYGFRLPTTPPPR